MKAIFTFHIDTDTGEAAMAGNITIQQALGIMQQLAIAEAVQASRDNGNKEAANATTGLPQQSTD